ncbi:hypothetical protein [Subtercola sp. YIM 133946]|uniref:hypothetical protein n=1 Tax=Subtercola sp. YIM 133946 TaxID=3118909 RepID=UPI002F92DDAD
MTTFNETASQQQTTAPDRTRRVSNETKPAFRTTEFILYIVIVVAVIITSIAVNGTTVTNSDGTQTNTPDPFDAAQAVQYIVFLTIGYMIARGLAKSGSRNSHTE